MSAPACTQFYCFVLLIGLCGSSVEMRWANLEPRYGPSFVRLGKKSPKIANQTELKYRFFSVFDFVFGLLLLEVWCPVLQPYQTEIPKQPNILVWISKWPTLASAAWPTSTPTHAPTLATSPTPTPPHSILTCSTRSPQQLCPHLTLAYMSTEADACAGGDEQALAATPVEASTVGARPASRLQRQLRVPSGSKHREVTPWW